MNVINSLFSAFLMYSRIPMPQVEWKEDNRKYVLCFFPLIGTVIGGLFLLWSEVCRQLQITPVLFSVISVGIPVWVTGGIHLDGFCDVHDALACMGGKEKKLAVMKDSRVGAFAVIHLCLYFLIQFGLVCQIHAFPTLAVCALGFVLSRAESGLCVTIFPPALPNSSVDHFKNSENKKIIMITEILYIIVISVIMIFIDIFSGLSVVVGSLCYMLYYKRFAVRNFGGVTGDLAGYFLQNCELLIIACAVIPTFVFR